jgi:hypothetical protein
MRSALLLSSIIGRKRPICPGLCFVVGRQTHPRTSPDDHVKASQARGFLRSETHAIVKLSDAQPSCVISLCSEIVFPNISRFSFSVGAGAFCPLRPPEPPSPLTKAAPGAGCGRTILHAPRAHRRNEKDGFHARGARTLRISRCAVCARGAFVSYRPTPAPKQLQW